MKSPQENLLRYISKHSIGYEYVFEPDEYAKGNARREPADLVWACNNCIILMYMAQRKYKKRKPEAHVLVRQEMIKHNLSQAKGWLSEWRNNGRSLSGKNAYRNFSIQANSFKYTIVISVVDCGDTLCEYHTDYESKLGVTFCVTLPQQALIDIAFIGGGILDILRLIEIMGMYSKGYPVEFGYGFDVNPIILFIQEKAFEQTEKILKDMKVSEDSILRLFNRNDRFVNDAVMNGIYNMIRRLRSPSKQQLSAMNLAEGWEVGEILNDMPLEDLYSLASALHMLVINAGTNHEYHGCASLKLGIYYVSIASVAMGGTDLTKLIVPSQKVLAETFNADSEARAMFALMWDTRLDQEIMIATFEMRNRKTRTEAQIENTLNRRAG